MNNEIIENFDNEIDENVKLFLSFIDKEKQILMIKASGYIDTYNSAFFSKKIKQASSCKFKNIILDMHEITYISSTGIGALVDISKEIAKVGGDIVITYVQPKVLEVFQLLGFYSFFNIKDNLTDAVDFLKKGGSSSIASIFPMDIQCPICNKRLKVPRAGRFKCGVCKSIFSINEIGAISL